MPILHRDGCPISYEIRGSGPPVLLLQGVGVHGSGWRPQVEALCGAFSCLSFDNRGIGASQPAGTAPLSVKQMADDALALLDAAGWTTAHVVGHSLGGLVAQQLAIMARGRVRSLSLLCTVANGRRAAPLTLRMLWLGARSRIGTRRMRRRAFLALVLAPEELMRVDLDQRAAELAPLFGHDLADQPPVAGKQLKALRRCDATPQLSTLNTVPTLVLCAEFDPIAPPYLGRALAAAIPGAKFVEIAGASHGLPIDRPGDVNRLLAGHFRACDAASLPRTE